MAAWPTCAAAALDHHPGHRRSNSRQVSASRHCVSSRRCPPPTASTPGNTGRARPGHPASGPEPRRRTAQHDPVHPPGHARDLAVTTLRQVIEALAGHDTTQAAGILAHAQPDSPGNTEPTAAACTGVALGLLDDWLTGADPHTPRPQAARTATSRAPERRTSRDRHPGPGPRRPRLRLARHPDRPARRRARPARQRPHPHRRRPDLGHQHRHATPRPNQHRRALNGYHPPASVTVLRRSLESALPVWLPATGAIRLTRPLNWSGLHVWD